MVWFKKSISFWLFGDGEQRKGVVRETLIYLTLIVSLSILKYGVRYGFPFPFLHNIGSVAYLVSIPLGIYSAYKKDTKFDRITSIVVFVLYLILFYWCIVIAHR